jgi:tetratricopeptide (TPR) repeat protein
MAKSEIRRSSGRLAHPSGAGDWAGEVRGRKVQGMRGNSLSALGAPALFALLLVPASGQADQRDPRLNTLFVELAKAADAAAADKLADEIWSIWHRSGDADIDRMLEVGVNAMYAGDYESAYAMFNTIVEKAPEFAEGWNKRAHVLYLTGNYDSSIADVKKTISLEPRHWNALHGMGLIYEEMGEPAEALRWFEKAFKIYPKMQQLREHIDELRKQTQGTEI